MLQFLLLLQRKYFPVLFLRSIFQFFIFYPLLRKSCDGAMLLTNLARFGVVQVKDFRFWLEVLLRYFAACLMDGVIQIRMHLILSLRYINNYASLIKRNLRGFHSCLQSLSHLFPPHPISQRSPLNPGGQTQSPLFSSQAPPLTHWHNLSHVGQPHFSASHPLTMTRSRAFSEGLCKQS